jgi:hypothetical protein
MKYLLDSPLMLHWEAGPGYEWVHAMQKAYPGA